MYTKHPGGLVKTLGSVVLLVVMLTSCLKYDGTITIRDDGSGTVDLLTAIDPSAFEALGEFGDLASELGTADEICQDFSTELGDTSALPVGATVAPFNEDGFCGTRVSYPLAASLDHSDALSDALDDSTRIYKQGDNWIFESNFSTEEITGEADDFGQEFAADLFEDASFVITVDLPGRAIEGGSNATKVGADGKFTWEIDLLNPPTELFAQTEPGSGGGSGGGISPLLIALIVAALAGAGALAWFMKQRSVSPTAAAPQRAAIDYAATPAAATAPQGEVAAGSFASTGSGVADAAKETVVMNPAQAMTAAASTAATSAVPEPVYDAVLDAWIVDDPKRGRMRHDPATDTWRPM